MLCFEPWLSSPDCRVAARVVPPPLAAASSVLVHVAKRGSSAHWTQQPRSWTPNKPVYQSITLIHIISAKRCPLQDTIFRRSVRCCPLYATGRPVTFTRLSDHLVGEPTSTVVNVIKHIYVYSCIVIQLSVSCLKLTWCLKTIIIIHKYFIFGFNAILCLYLNQ